MAKMKKKRSAKAKGIAICAICAAAVALAIGVNYLVALRSYVRDVSAIQVQSVDLTTIKDGEYFGGADVGFISARVRVVVENHTIAELELLEHNHDRGEAASVLPDRMLEEQRIDVDAVSGATNSSKVIQEAVYNALTGERTIRQ